MKCCCESLRQRATRAVLVPRVETLIDERCRALQSNSLRAQSSWQISYDNVVLNNAPKRFSSHGGEGQVRDILNRQGRSGRTLFPNQRSALNRTSAATTQSSGPICVNFMD